MNLWSDIHKLHIQGNTCHENIDASSTSVIELRRRQRQGSRVENAKVTPLTHSNNSTNHRIFSKWRKSRKIVKRSKWWQCKVQDRSSLLLYISSNLSRYHPGSLGKIQKIKEKLIYKWESLSSATRHDIIPPLRNVWKGLLFNDLICNAVQIIIINI